MSNKNNYQHILKFTDTAETGSQLDTLMEAEASEAEVPIQRSARDRHPPDYYRRGECNPTLTSSAFKGIVSCYKG